jgi:hypothetical protein
LRIELISDEGFVMVELLVLLTNLNHWLSHVLSLLKHLQVLVTMVLGMPFG